MKKATIEQIVLKSGLWDDGRKSTHGFILSPNVYEVTREKRGVFENIGLALQDCLSGLGRIAAIAGNPLLARNKTWQMIDRICRTGVPAVYHDIQLLRPNKTPAICKIDFMEASDGNLYVAEIDGHNKHGLGYSTLTARIRKTLMLQNNSAFPGVATLLAQQTKQRGADDLGLLYANQERFYLPEFKILQSELAKHDINLIITSEDSLEKDTSSRLLVDFPFLYHRQALNQRLSELYARQEIDFLIPPKPFFGSKAIMALLRNDEQNPELEAILLSQIKPAYLETIRAHIPETYLVSKNQPLTYWQKCCNGKKFVLKKTISSGMKGVVFRDAANFQQTLLKACGSYYHFVLQQEVVNEPRKLSYFADDGELIEDNWYARITVHYSVRQVADIIVTARRDKRVHGASDCLQIGAVLV